MGFINAAALSLLGLIPLITLLYFMKLRRKDVVVSSHYLWTKALEQARVDSFFQKFRANLLLLLQIITILLAVMALSRPYYTTEGSIAPEVIVVLDSSVGMQAVESAGPRFQRAREEVRRLISEAFMGTRFMLIGAAAQPRVLCSFTSDKEAVRSALSALQPSDEPLQVRPALLLATSIAGTRPSAEIYYVSSRPPEGVPLDAVAGRFHFVPIGESVANVGIVSFAVRPVPSAAQSEAFVQLRNFSPEAKSGYLEIRRGDRMVEAREVNLAADAGQAYLFRLTPPATPSTEPDVLQARLELKDALAVDNQAWCVLQSARTPRLLLVTRGNPFLERALSLIDGHETFRVTPQQYRGSKGYDVTIWDGIKPEVAPTEGNHIMLSAGQGAPINGPFEITWERSHPLFRYVDLSEVHVGSAPRLELPNQARILASTPATALIGLVESARYRALLIGFDVYQSDWPLSVSFPVFLANAVRYLESGGTGRPPSQIRTGTPIPLEFLGNATDVVVTPPGSTPQAVNAAAFGDTSKIGVYGVQASRGQWKVAVNLLDEASSDLRVAAAGPLPNTPGAAPQAAGLAPATREFWWPVVLAALLLLVFEWYYYHRRM